MALFKPLKGTRTSLDSQPLHDGYAYFCIDDGSFHIDYTDADGNLQRKQLNAKDAETLMGKSLIELQSDWSVNDPADPAYVQNRTHWMSVDHVTWFNNETMAFEAFNGAYNAQIAIDESILNVGHTYTFVIDNTTFESVAYEFEGMVCLGNLSILDSSLTNTNELFLVCSPLRDGVGGADGNFIMIATSLEGASHTITLSADVTTYHKIDENYLPYIVGRPGERVGSEIFNDYENNFAGGAYAHAEGKSTWASGYASHAEGELTKATFENAHAEGNETTASGSNSHAEGNKTTASSYNAHAEGNATVASGHSSHAEGLRTEASGQGSHAEGHDTKATAYSAHAEGYGTKAASKSQHVFGEYNIVDESSGVAEKGEYIQIAGNGKSENNRSNAHTLDWSGNAWYAGDVKVGGTGQDDETAKTLATTEYVDSKAGGWEVLMDVTLEEECVDVIGITLTDKQKEKIAKGDFVCYAECPPPTTTASAGWICGGLWADNMYYFILSGFGQPSGIVPASTDTHTSKIYSNLKNASGDMRIRDMLCATLGTPYQVVDFMDTSEYMIHYQTQPLTVRFKTNGVFAVGTRLVCKVR